MVYGARNREGGLEGGLLSKSRPRRPCWYQGISGHKKLMYVRGLGVKAWQYFCSIKPCDGLSTFSITRINVFWPEVLAPFWSDSIFILLRSQFNSKKLILQQKEKKDTTCGSFQRFVQITFSCWMFSAKFGRFHQTTIIAFLLRSFCTGVILLLSWLLFKEIMDLLLDTTSYLNTEVKRQDRTLILKWEIPSASSVQIRMLLTGEWRESGGCIV